MIVIKCPGCGKEVDSLSFLCDYCGYQVNTREQLSGKTIDCTKGLMKRIASRQCYLFGVGIQHSSKNLDFVQSKQNESLFYYFYGQMSKDNKYTDFYIRCFTPMIYIEDPDYPVHSYKMREKWNVKLVGSKNFNWKTRGLFKKHKVELLSFTLLGHEENNVFYPIIYFKHWIPKTESYNRCGYIRADFLIDDEKISFLIGDKGISSRQYISEWDI